jgi:hypothetical protein
LKLQMNWLSKRNDWLKFKISEKLTIIVEEFIEYTPIQQRQPESCQHVIA